MLGQRLVVLRNLVALGQVGIEIILAREDRRFVDAASSAPSQPAWQLDRLPVQHRQRSGHAQANRANIRVGRTPKRVNRSRKSSRRQQLNVHFEAR